MAQQDIERFIIRLVSATAQSGLVNVSVQGVAVAVPISQLVNVQGNNIAVVVQAPIDVVAGVSALVCATVLSSGQQVCNTITDVTGPGPSQTILNLPQIQ